ECWDKYRKHDDSSVSVMKKSGNHRTARLFYLNWLERYLTREDVQSPEVWKALRSALWRERHPTLASTLARGRLRMIRQASIRVARHTVPRPVRAWLRARWNRTQYCPPPGWVRFGSLRRAAPISRSFGNDRGLPVDRFYIERFLATHAECIRGRVLEV